MQTTSAASNTRRVALILIAEGACLLIPQLAAAVLGTLKFFVSGLNLLLGPSIYWWSFGEKYPSLAWLGLGCLFAGFFLAMLINAFEGFASTPASLHTRVWRVSLQKVLLWITLICLLLAVVTQTARATVCLGIWIATFTIVNMKMVMNITPSRFTVAAATGTALAIAGLATTAVVHFTSATAALDTEVSREDINQRMWWCLAAVLSTVVGSIVRGISPHEPRPEN